MLSLIDSVRLEGISACVPKTVVDNITFGRDLFGDKLESLIKSTGIERRRICADSGLTSFDLAVRAAQRLVGTAEFPADSFGAVVFVTLTPDSLMPNNATAVQSALLLPENTACFDINHACSGYVYGLWVSALLARSTRKRVLLLDADTNSYYVSPSDKSTGLLFGDAGTASVVGFAEGSAEWAFDFFTDGTKRSSVEIPGFGYRQRLGPASLEYRTFDDGSRRRPIDMAMNSLDVFTYVVNVVSGYLVNFMDERGADGNAFDYLILHQANGFMLRQLGRKIEFPVDKIPMSMNKYGNTSSASIPLNIASELEGRLNGKRMLLSGFGAGLSCGIADIRTYDVVFRGVTDY